MLPVGAAQVQLPTPLLLNQAEAEYSVMDGLRLTCPSGAWAVMYCPDASCTLILLFTKLQVPAPAYLGLTVAVNQSKLLPLVCCMLLLSLKHT